MEKNITKPGSPIQNRRGRNWHLLFVDDHGKMISFQWLKNAAMIIIISLLFFIVCSISLFALYRSHQNENIQLKEKLEESIKENKSLRNEMDILLARVVRTESKKEPDHDKKPSLEEEQIILSSESKQTVDVIEDSHPVQEAEKETIKEPVQQTKLGVINFNINRGSGSPDSLKISFVINNIDQSVKTASGYILIVLKPDENDQNTWFSVPPTELKGGYPIHAKEGQFFRISRFKTVYFQSKSQIPLEQLKIASVFVFDMQGKPVLEKKFPL
jgi:hypothetical protein